MILKTPIIPTKSTFFGKKSALDYKAICVFVATGFFLDQDTYYTEQKVLKPGYDYEIDEVSKEIISEKPYFKWHYTPRERTLSQITSEFAVLFETIIKEQISDKKVILPLSGGLDSRTQAVALHHLGAHVKSYSYSFFNGLNETLYAKKIAKKCNFLFQDWKVKPNYLWRKIEKLAKINNCYSEFTHPRQMAFVDEYKDLGEIFSLGHWGDVLFDDMGVDNDLPCEAQIQIILKKIIKNGGLELAESLWKTWQIEGDFMLYLSDRIKKLLNEINIPNNANAQIRAFKSKFWATRWTNTNLSIFESVRPISVPYFDNRMCEFICSVPEKYLSGRQIQIEYIKMRMPEIAKITWQDHRPFNLYNYKWNKIPYNLPYRIFSKLTKIISNKKYIQRNWELQFLGSENNMELQKWLFDNDFFSKLIPKDVVQTFYNDFKNKDEVYFSHSVSMLLTLSLFSKNNL